jgi:hypothetical protein
MNRNDEALNGGGTGLDRHGLSPILVSCRCRSRARERHLIGVDFLGTRIVLPRRRGEASRQMRVVPAGRNRRGPAALPESPLEVGRCWYLRPHPDGRQDPAGTKMVTYPAAKAWGLVRV